jgi:class 3 adenylate cyclase/predicted ATPase
VSIVFSDLSGSTSLGEQLDPEALRRVMSRYFDEMQAAVERHGGMVEKFIGDAVMAVFGIPRLHEDDALRAVRAATDMRDALGRLNEELGAQLQARIGVNTGEVVAGDPSAGQRLVTGDAVNVAARLEQAAAPGQILLGAPTYRLVGDAVRADAVEPLELKGKAQPVDAYALHSIEADVPAFARRLDAPFVGRRRELELVEAELARAVEERAFRLVTVLGPAGIGKSRLIREVLGASADRARSVVGRCLAYGDGITYWPLVEIIRQLGSGDARTTTERLVVGEEHAGLIAERVAAAIGQAESGGETEETFWAVRKVLESLARERPAIVVLDDLHWAEPTFLDLVEYLVAFSSGAPILLVCVARAELLDARPAWTAPRPNASSILLEPLAEDDTGELIELLLEGPELSPDTRERILDTAEGNPLFVEQMLALRAESGNGELEVPPTIQALLASRIDRLGEDERSVIERASVEGRLFHRGAVSELAPANVRPAVSTHLLGLVRKELVRPDRAEFAGDDGFRFSHILIRDAAYAALPKELRAELHERYADWLEDKTEERAHEYGEIVGYHLEQAHGYRRELGTRGESVDALGKRAGLVLAGAGERALARSDTHAALNMIERALALLPDADPHRDRLRFSLGDVLIERGEFERGLGVLDELADEALRAGDMRRRWPPVLRAALVRLQTVELPASEIEELARKALAELAESGDDSALALAWQLFALARNMLGDTPGLEAAMQEAYAHAQKAGSARLVTHSAFWLGLCAVYGPAPLSEAVATCERLLDAAVTPIQRAQARCWLSASQALAGDPESLAGLQEARAMFAELGLKQAYGGTAIAAGEIERLLGKLEAAELTLRDAADTLAESGDRSHRSTVFILLGHVLFDQGRLEEAEVALAQGEELGSSEDVLNAAYGPWLGAKLALRRGRLDEAERLARQGIVAYEGEESPTWEAEGFMTLAAVLSTAGRTDEAREAGERALELYEQKGSTPGIELARTMLAELAQT